jgi:hypothetical protein
MRSISILAVAAGLLLCGCSKNTITDENYAKITDGMAQSEVDTILGRGTSSGRGVICYDGTDNPGRKPMKMTGRVIRIEYVDERVVKKEILNPQK